jgi:hypothetical protein
VGLLGCVALVATLPPQALLTGGITVVTGVVARAIACDDARATDTPTTRPD